MAVKKSAKVARQSKQVRLIARATGSDKTPNRKRGSARRSASDPAVPLSPTKAKLIRDVLFAWTYVAHGQLKNLANTNIDNDTLVEKILTVLSPHVNMTKKLSDGIGGWVKAIRKGDNLKAFQSTDRVFRSQATDPWPGDVEHPTDKELSSVFANLQSVRKRNGTRK